MKFDTAVEKWSKNIEYVAANLVLGAFYDEKIPCSIGIQIFSFKCGFGIGYSIDQKN